MSKPCPGWPFGTGCLTIIDDDRLICTFHEGTRQRWHEAQDSEMVPATSQSASSWEPVGRTLREMDPLPTCICGGYREATGHEQSLLHIAYTNHKSWEGRQQTELERSERRRIHWPR